MNSRYSVSLRIRRARFLSLWFVIKWEYPQVGQVANNVIHFVSLLKLDDIPCIDRRGPPSIM
jgi:hypothetical protein